MSSLLQRTPSELVSKSRRCKERGRRSRGVRGMSLEQLEGRSLLATLVADVIGGTTDTGIAGTVYEDLNSDGVRNNGENGIEGWRVFLDLDSSGTWNQDAVGDDEPFAFTNQDGDFSINRLQPGNYRVAEEVAGGWVPTSPASLDVAVELHRTTDVEFFNFGGGTIVGTVWNDLNQDGVRDIDSSTGSYIDPGLVGWTVFLDLNKNDAQDPAEPTTLTDPEGRYSFTNLPADDYEVWEVVPDGWDISPGFDNKQTAAVTALQTTTQDFANFSDVNGSLRGVIWNDVNINGDRDFNPTTGEFTEQGLADWTVFLDTNENGAFDDGEPTTLTDSDGSYIFNSLAAGNYDVYEVLPDGWDVSPGYNSNQRVIVSAGELTKAEDFANFTITNGSIRGAVWNDVNRNGLRDTDLTGAFLDPGLAGWTIFLDLNGDGIISELEPTVLTDAAGSYTFLDLQIGEYSVREVLPSGWETTTTFSEDVNVVVYSGTESIAPDFANFNIATAVPGSISGSVWNDRNANGVREVDAGDGSFLDPGLAGWTIFADLNSNGSLDATEPSAVSAADGAYSLSGIRPGSVSVIEVSTTGWRATAPSSGIRSLSLRNGQNLTGVDFGNAEIQDSSIRGIVYVDADKNGSRSAGEKGLAGITVYLDLNNNSAIDLGEPQTGTSADLFFTPAENEAGTYSFTHLASGTYTVRAVLPASLSATPAEQLVHTVTIVASESHNGVNTGAIYRATEVHGVRYDDRDGDQIQDDDELGVAGATVYVDLDRDDVHDEDEPTTITGPDGSYTFTGLAPGSYVVRTEISSEYEHTYPTTTSGTLWPSGTSNSAVGNVTPSSITASLANGESLRQSVSLTLPTTGALTNLVDVFLLFDDTGSFTYNSPIVRGAFPTIISELQMLLPGIDLGFGVGRLEEYASFAYEYSSGRPFVLNQPIVAASTPDYMTAIQAALNRTAPGYGGDQPETDIEALYQLVTGVGFDGNNNGSVLDSGPAGLASTQVSPGASGDVPSFASFVADPANNVMAAAGSVGGGGFRAGALPIILLATDTGFAYQPKGESVITGVGGASLPISAFTQTSRPTTPFDSGAGIQQTITALNALGALVIGLGTNPQATLDPRQGLEAISKLTGATNQTTTTIANGTADPIAPGDPFYFQITSGFASSVSPGIVSAIQNAATNVAYNITVQASDPRVRIINHTGVATSIGSGQTATFDVEIVGDGAPHRFDLQFVREGTNVVLGSIPVVIGTPIAGEGYEFEDLEDGEICHSVDFGTRLATATSVNVAPSFVIGANQIVAEDAGAQSVAWATAISAGPESEAGQSLNFLVSNDQGTLFQVAPSISADGTLTYTPAPNAFGSSTVTVRLHDDGGTAGGGEDTSGSQSFTITITPVNDVPTAVGDAFSVDEDGTLNGTGLLGNDSDLDGDLLTSTVVSSPSHGTLSLAADGSFSYQPDANFHGVDSFTYVANDGTVDSAPATVTITVGEVNDVPTAVGDNYAVDEDGTLTVTVGVLLNDEDLDGDLLTSTVVSSPSHGTLSLAADGSFSYQPDANFHGVDSFTYVANDGTVDSAPATVTITVGEVNDAPTANNDAYSVTAGETLTVVASGVLSNDTDVELDGLTAQQVALPSHGTLLLQSDGSFSYQPVAGYVGVDTFTYMASDGAANSAVATVTIQVTAAVVNAKFFVIDDVSPRIYQYDAAGQSLPSNRLQLASQPRGITASADGSAFWVADHSGWITVYDATGCLTGSWRARNLNDVEGIATDGQNIWLVDNHRDRVYYFANATTRRSGTITATSSFALNRNNRNPTDIATDGVHLWVANDKGRLDQVFRYTIDGQLEGSWRLDAANSQPTGLTIDPNNVDHLWIVDAKRDAIFEYQHAAGRLSGVQAADAVFALASGNRRPQGIIDPRTALGTATVYKSVTSSVAEVSDENFLLDRALLDLMREISSKDDRDSILLAAIDDIVEDQLNR